MTIKSIAFSSITIILPLLVSLLVLESLLRVWYFFHNRAEPPFSHQASDLGWRPTENLSMNYHRKNYGEIQFSSSTDGFRRYGNPNSNKIKTLVVGDSFTQAYHVSDGKAYFDYLAGANSNLEVFAFGSGGYGTTQQAMAIEQYATSLSPKIIVWQFSGNDFINNDWLLESQSNENSNHMRRPFNEDGTIVHRHPDGRLGWLAERSFLARRLGIVLSSFRKRTEGTIENELSMSHPDLQRAVSTTQSIVAGSLAKFPQVKFYAFFAGKEYFSWELAAFAKVCETPKLNCIFEVERALAAAATDDQVVDGGLDGHWNETGHQIAGQTVLSALSVNPVQ